MTEPIMNPAQDAANPRAALVVFCRRPVPGVGKQRLARGLGREAAHAVATALLACTLEDLDDWAGPVVLSPADAADLDWARALLAARAGLHPRSCVVPQPEANLGERLEAGLGEEDRLDREARGFDQAAERDLAFDDEAAVIAREVALLHADVRRKARV